jgi:hypothetical protein
MPAGDPLVSAQSPNAKDVAGVGDNLKPGWITRLDEAMNSRGNVMWMGDKEYRIGKRLGGGSFGLVFEGDQLSKDGRLPVAIKFVGDTP